MKEEKEKQMELDQECGRYFEDTLRRLRDAKPEDRSELARRYAVTITELEKVYAYFDTYVIRGSDV